MARTLQHIVEDESKTIFSARMQGFSSERLNIGRGDVIFRELTGRDYGVDGQIELFENGEPTGRIAYIQLKGTSKKIEKLKRTDEVSCTGISKSNISYCRQQNVPVMLAYISTADNTFYYIDLQSVYQQTLNAIGDHESGTVRIPLENSSQELDKFFEIFNGYYNRQEMPKITQTRTVAVDEPGDQDTIAEDGYVFRQYEIPSDGEHQCVNIRGEILAAGYWEHGRLEKGTEYDYLIRATNGELIYKPDDVDDPYDATEDFAYERMEAYAGEPLRHLSLSAPYIEHEGLDRYYIADIEVDGDMEQLTNIRTLEEFLKEREPQLLESLLAGMEE